jgi:hypothetical protein
VATITAVGRQHSRIPVLLTVAVVFATAGCGSTGRTSQPRADTTSETTPASTPEAARNVAPIAKDDVAVVGTEHITKAEVDALIAEFRAVNVSEHRPFPASGTAAYKEYQDEAVDYFVRGAVFEQEAHKRLGIEIGDKQVERSIAQIRNHAFGGSEARMMKHFRDLGIDRQQLARFQRLQLAEDRLPAILAARAHLVVSEAQARSYYSEHLRHFRGQTFAQARRAATAAVMQAETNDLVRSWTARIVRGTCGEIRYQRGYHPANLVCDAT